MMPNTIMPTADDGSDQGRVGRLVRSVVKWWDWRVYGLAHASIRRMVKRNPGYAYLMELWLRDWNATHPLPDRVCRATEQFYAGIRETSKGYGHNPAHPIGTCRGCGEEMTYNVPRLGPDGGFVHKWTGRYECSSPNITVEHSPK